MAFFSTQLVGEKVLYDQPVINDTIVGATWVVSPIGPTLSGQTNTGTNAMVAMKSLNPGVFSLQVSVQLASGQVRKNRVLVTVEE